MNILLLLSALLSALSSLGGASRVAEQQPAVVCPFAVAAKSSARRATAARTVPFASFDPMRVITSSIDTSWRVAAIIAPWTLRRRE